MSAEREFRRRLSTELAPIPFIAIRGKAYTSSREKRKRRSWSLRPSGSWWWLEPKLLLQQVCNIAASAAIEESCRCSPTIGTFVLMKSNTVVTATFACSGLIPAFSLTTLDDVVHDAPQLS